MRSIGNKIGKLVIPVTLLLVAFLFLVAITTQFGLPSNNPQAGATKKACVPTPAKPTKSAGISQTSSPSTILTNMAFITPETGSAATPLPVSKTTDLSMDLSDDAKTYVYVMHCDGSIELFKVKPSGDILASIPLQSDDYIYGISPSGLTFGQQPPKGPYPSEIPSNTPVPLREGYPPPSTPTNTPTNLPYP